jgi:hypothetical protein
MAKQEIESVGIMEKLTSMTEMFKSLEMKIEKIERKVDSNDSPVDISPLASGLEIENQASLDKMIDIICGIQSDSLHGIGCDLDGADSARFKTWMRTTEKSIASKKVNVLTGSTAFVAWKEEVKKDLRLCMLLPVVEEPKSQGAVAAMSPLKRNQWIFADLLVTSYLTSRLGEKQKLVCAECKSAADIWVLLHETYASKSAATQHRLTEEWSFIVQKQQETMTDYIQRLNTQALVMRDADCPLSDQQRRFKLLSGLSEDYDIEKRIFASQNLSYQELCKAFIEMPALKRPQGVRSGGQSYVHSANYAKERGVGMADRPNICLVCGLDRHMTYDCPTGLTRNKDARGQWIPRCFNCLEEGHLSKMCRQPKRPWGTAKPGKRGGGGLIETGGPVPVDK